MERKRFKEVLKLREISGKDFANSIGLSYGSYRSAMSRGNCPKWVLAFLVGHDSMDGDIIEVLRNGQRIIIGSFDLGFGKDKTGYSKFRNKGLGGITFEDIDKEEFEKDAMFVDPNDVGEIDIPADVKTWQERLSEQKGEN